MSKTRFLASMYVQDLTVSAAISVSSMAVDTTFTPPAQSIDLGTASSGDSTSKLNGVYLSYVFTGAVSAAVTHGLGQAVKGWWVVQTNAPLASGQVVYCSDLVTSTTTLTLAALGTATIKVFAF